ncbi:uncharacterized protein LOC127161944 [Labeo rohita]|uniref:uncharacterized protein LOC127161944 n=1 Tax=Labeo rohita TaxID=84645 RepID=UPI0021E1CF4D|nr:uncharacterized protein LOC127161944 [Labeo rohita]
MQINNVVRVAKKFDLPTMDVKVFDDTKTEVDEEAFEYLMTRPDLGVLEIFITGKASLDDSLSSSSLGDTEGTSESDDVAMLMRSPPEKNEAEERRLAQMIEDILKNSPGGERVINEYARTKSLSDARRRDMVKILVAHLTNEHGTRPSRRMKEEYAKGIVSLFPNLADPRSKLGYIDQDFGLLFGDATSAKLLEKWSTSIKPKVIAQSRGLTQTCELQDLIQNAEATVEVEEGWDSDMSSILMLVHLLPPSSQGRKRPGKISARQACDRLVKFIKTGTSIQGHLDSIGERLQPYLLAVGPKRSRVHSWFIVIDQHALPCKASNSLACVDELFKAHYVFGTSYSAQR